jgi:hypothetical protein
MSRKPKINKYADLPLTHGTGHQYNHRVTIKYTDACGNVRAIKNEFTRDNNWLWQKILIRTGKMLGPLGEMCTVEWQKVCHKRDILEIEDTYGV